MSIRLLSVLLVVTAFATAAEPKLERVLFVGNSITRHGPAPKIGWTGNWGMAASEEAKDYVHRVVAAIEQRTGKRPDFRVVNVAEFERGFEGYDAAAKLKEEIAFQPDAIVLAIGENVPALKAPDSPKKLADATVRLIRQLQGGRPCVVYVRSCFWAEPVRDGALRDACTAVGGVFVDVGALGKDEANYARSERKFEHDGVARHPGDRGMQALADAIAAAMVKSGK